MLGFACVLYDCNVACYVNILLKQNLVDRALSFSVNLNIIFSLLWAFTCYKQVVGLLPKISFIYSSNRSYEDLMQVLVNCVNDKYVFLFLYLEHDYGCSD